MYLFEVALRLCVCVRVCIIRVACDMHVLGVFFNLTSKLISHYKIFNYGLV